MFRTSLRSIGGPLRGHVCISCRVRSAHNVRLQPVRWNSNSSITPSKAEQLEDQSQEPSSSVPKSRRSLPPEEDVKEDDEPSNPSEEEYAPNLRIIRVETKAPQPSKRKGLPKRAKNQSGSAAGPGRSRRVQGDNGKPSKRRSILKHKKGSSGPPKGLKQAQDPDQEESEHTTYKKTKKSKPPRDDEDDNATTALMKTVKQSLVRPNRSTAPPGSQGRLPSTSSGKSSGKAKGSDDNGELTYLAKHVKEKHIGSLQSSEVGITPLEMETATVPGLSFGLERVLFNPGVYQLQDPRSRVFNFDPYLGSIMPVTEFDFNALKQYITSSQDETLLQLAINERKKYIGSSSSMTSVLSQFHYLLSSWRPVNIGTLSKDFPDNLLTFTRLLRGPAAMFLHYKDGVYAIDADKEFDTANILMNLGKSMEKLLTLPKEEFERYRRSSTNKITAEEEQANPESYHYSTAGDFLMRSQLDAHDPRLPGTGMFDLKTRAVVSIRMDAKNFEKGLGYEIRHRFGGYESYEREYYDMIRAAFLKYALQVRIGRMDGIFVAFHNVERIFGFQYVSLPEMDEALHGQSDTTLGDKEFHFSLALWNNILDKATAKFPQQSLRFHFETRDARKPFMYIFAEPVTSEEIEAIQTKNKEEIEAFQRRILNLAPKEDEVEASTTSDSPSEIPAEDSTVEETQPDEPVTSVDELEAEAAEETTTTAEESTEEPAPSRPLLAMLLSVDQKVNGRPCIRPEGFTAKDSWEIKYDLSEIEGDRMWDLYRQCQRRRKKVLADKSEDDTGVANNAYVRTLHQKAAEGRKWRKEQEALDKGRGIFVLGEDTPRSSI